MPRTAITPITPKGAYPTLPISAGTATYAPVAADPTNFNSAVYGAANTLLVIALNTDASAHTVTITSATDQFNRTGDITAYSIAAASGGTPGVSILGPFKRDGWRQTGDVLHFAANDATIKFLVVGLN